MYGVVLLRGLTPQPPLLQRGGAEPERVGTDHETALTFGEQVTTVWYERCYIATWFEEENTIGLYLTASGFVDLYCDHTANHLVERTRAFPYEDKDSLEDSLVRETVRFDGTIDWR